MSGYKGFRMVEVSRSINGNVQSKALTTWMPREDAFAFARNSGGGTVQSRRGRFYSIVVNYNDHAKSLGF
jgi:hypothetical protein